ncbi:hypothetical protein [Sphaerisporangium rubeum]|uniref:Uncharacterized protein n=1 Tax=Sphaerisporangium rubeum TaxID=321317 RepID=A0A7X0IIV8_9ACTN|nr:hypothetical protein [Sphaerisporangium rubeum]MBB6475748.1 hypothetical protein [Sphaerisporangium rubeum]
MTSPTAVRGTPSAGPITPPPVKPPSPLTPGPIAPPPIKPPSPLTPGPTTPPKQA